MHGAPPAPEFTWHGPRTEAERWRSVSRPQVLRLIAGSTRRLSWTGRLLTLLLEELYVENNSRVGREGFTDDRVSELRDS